MWVQGTIRWGQDRTNPFASASGDKSAMRPFTILLWTLVCRRLYVFIVKMCNSGEKEASNVG